MNRIRTLFAIALFYLGLALLMTWPLVTRLGTHIPGGGSDEQTVLWNFWWIKHAIVDLGINPYYTDMILVPYGASFVIYQLMLIHALISIPLQYFLSLPSIVNLFILISLTLSGLGTYMLVERLTGNRSAGIIAGAIFAFSPVTMAQLPTHYSIGMTMIHPFYTLFLIKAFEDRANTLRDTAIAGVLLGLTFHIDHYHFISLILFTSLFTAFKLVTERGRIPAHLSRFALIGLCSAPFVVPVLLLLIKDILSGTIRTTPSGAIFAADLLGFISPSPSNPLLGQLSLAQHFTGNTTENVVYVGVTAWLLALTGAIESRRAPLMRFWIIAAAFFFVLALGPTIQIMGRSTGIPMPSLVFDYIPILKNLRAPSRLWIIGMLPVAICAGYGVAALVKHRIALTTVLCAAIIAEYAVIPMPLFDSSVPKIYKLIAGDKEAETVLDVPFYVYDGYNCMGKALPYIQPYQAIHMKKIFSATVCRIQSSTIFNSFLNLPVLRTLPFLERNMRIKQEAVEVDRRLAGEVIGLFGIGYVVLHRQEGNALVDRATKDYLEYVIPMRKIYEDDKVIAYKTNLQRKPETVIDLGAEQSIPYLMHGWINGQSEGARTFAWITLDESVLLANLEKGRSYSMDITLMPAQGLAGRNVSVLINSTPVQTIAMSPGWKAYSLVIPDKAVRPGLNRIVFRPEASTPTDKDFGGVISQGAYFEVLRTFSNDGVKETRQPHDWEQDNSKFIGARVSAAVDIITIRPQNP